MVAAARVVWSRGDTVRGVARTTASPLGSPTGTRRPWHTGSPSLLRALPLCSVAARDGAERPEQGHAARSPDRCSPVHRAVGSTRVVHARVLRHTPVLMPPRGCQQIVVEEALALEHQSMNNLTFVWRSYQHTGELSGLSLVVSDSHNNANNVNATNQYRDRINPAA